MIGILLFLSAAAPQETADAFTHGPSYGGVTQTSAIVWARAAHPGTARLSLYSGDGFGGDGETRVFTVEAGSSTDQCVKWTLDGLDPYRIYQYSITLDAAGDDKRYRLITAPPLSSKRANIAFGSCSNDKTFPVQPIWTRIMESPAEAMVLLGDTPYIDSTELDVQRRRYREFYGMKELAALCEQIPFYSTWDDHDFGRNDSTGYLPQKERSRQAFTEYHPNPSFGAADAAIYTSFRRGPIEVFLLDTRWFAAVEPSPLDEGKPTLLGAAQWAWLKQGLKESDATFKVLASGMIWNQATRPFKTDHWAQYPYERNALFRYIGKEKISGVILVGGDIHRTRAVRHDTQKSAGYPLIELITSPLANTVIESANAPHPGLLADRGIDQTFLLLTADATVEPAQLEARFIDAKGVAQIALTFSADELSQE
jgi:alkaline phosphatase D